MNKKSIQVNPFRIQEHLGYSNVHIHIWEDVLLDNKQSGKDSAGTGEIDSSRPSVLSQALVFKSNIVLMASDRYSWESYESLGEEGILVCRTYAGQPHWPH